MAEGNFPKSKYMDLTAKNVEAIDRSMPTYCQFDGCVNTCSSGKHFYRFPREQNSECKEKIFRKSKKLNLDVVEQMSDCKVSAEEFIDKCQFMDKEFYDALIEERNVCHRCGYPLCSKCIQNIKQQFHIVPSRKKVYDLKERKCFCSETCYAASNFVRCQLLDFVTEENDEPNIVKLLSDHKNNGCIGEVITMKHEQYSQEEIDKKNLANESLARELKKLIVNELTKDAEQFGEFEVKAQSLSDAKNTTIDNEEFSEDMVLTKSQKDDSFTKEIKNPTPDERANDNKQVEQPEQSNIVPVNKTGNRKPPVAVKSSPSCSHVVQHTCSSKKSSDNSNDSESDVSDDNDDIYFYPKEVNITSKKLPVSKESKKIQSTRVIELVPESMTSPSQRQRVSKDYVVHILKDWITPASVELIKNEISKHPETPVPEDTIHDPIIDKDNMSQITKLCTTSNLEPNNSDKESSTEARTVDEEDCNEFTGIKVTKSLSDPYLEKVKDFLKGEERLQKENAVASVKFKTGRKGKLRIVKNEVAKSESSNVSSSTSENTESEKMPVLPAIHSLSKNLVRQEVVCRSLKNAFCDILPFIQLEYRIFDDIILQLVATFKLTAENVILKPREWKLAAIILFQMIMSGPLLNDVVSTHITANSVFRLLEKTALIQSISVQDIDNLIHRLLLDEMVKDS